LQKGKTTMNTETAADEVIDAIALIEMNRQKMEQEAGLAAACNEALRKLHELLDHEQELLQRHGPGTRHSANVEAVKTGIKKIRNLGGISGMLPVSRSPRSGQHPVPVQRGARIPQRRKGRRTMGRRGDR